MATERYSVGTRVVLMEDHRASPAYGRKGWVGTVTASFNEDDESYHEAGGYQVTLDDSGLTWRVNASSLDLLDKGYSDADLVMALELVDLLDVEWRVADAYLGQWTAGLWLRQQVFNELKARVR